MHAYRTGIAHGMDLLVERRTAPLQRDRGTQQLPAPVRGQIRPVNDDHWILHPGKMFVRKRCMDLRHFLMECWIAQQPVDALDVVFRAYTTRQTAPQVTQGERGTRNGRIRGDAETG